MVVDCPSWRSSKTHGAEVEIWCQLIWQIGHYWSGAELWIKKWPAFLTNEWPINSDFSFQWSGHSKLPLGWFLRNLKTFIFERKSSFLLKITKIITRVISMVFTNPPYIWFSRFLENGYFENDYFCSKFEKSYIEWMRKNSP